MGLCIVANVRRGAAVDYVPRPVQPDRLKQTCASVQSALKQRAKRTATASTVEWAVTERWRNCVAFSLRRA